MGNKIAVENLAVVSKRVLLGAYVILPVLLAVVMIDMFYLGHKLQPYLGIQALAFPIFVFFFLLPHIIASFFSFFDKEYVQYYRKHLFIYLPLLLIGTALLLYENYYWGLAFFFINDSWHGVRQKVGIALILGAKPGLLHRLWTIIPFVVTSLIYVYYIIPEVIPQPIINVLSEALFVGILSILVLMVIIMRRSLPKARLYIFLVSIFFLVSYFFVLAGYVFFAFLAFRFIHDVTAFAFYIVHDQNRNRDGYKNFFFRALAAIPVPIMVLVPVLGLLFAYVVRTAVNGLAIGFSIIILICMSHFYLESVMWKRNAPHRQSVRVV